LSLGWIEEDRLKPVYERGNAVVGNVILAHCVLSIWLASIYNTWEVSTAVAIPAAFLFFGMKQWRPFGLETRMAGCLSLMTFCMLHIYQMYGLPEMHFFFFTSLVAMLAYRDHRALYPGVFLIIAQHVLMTLDVTESFASHFWGTREVSPTVLAIHFGIALAATALAASNMLQGRKEYLDTVQLASQFKDQAEELAEAKLKLGRGQTQVGSGLEATGPPRRSPPGTNGGATNEGRFTRVHELQHDWRARAARRHGDHGRPDRPAEHR